jgi:hypothetical protein
MHRSLRHQIGFVVLTLALVVATGAREGSAGQGRGFMSSDQRGSQRGSGKAPDVTGSWVLEIKPSPGGGLPPEIKGLITFDEGGGCVETIILPPVTPAHGAWLRTGRREFTFSIVHHLVDPGGNFVGTVKPRLAQPLSTKTCSRRCSTARFSTRPATPWPPSAAPSAVLGSWPRRRRVEYTGRSGGPATARLERPALTSLTMSGLSAGEKKPLKVNPSDVKTYTEPC